MQRALRAIAIVVIPSCLFIFVSAVAGIIDLNRLLEKITYKGFPYTNQTIIDYNMISLQKRLYLLTAVIAAVGISIAVAWLFTYPRHSVVDKEDFEGMMEDIDKWKKERDDK